MMKNTKFSRVSSPESFEAPASSEREVNLQHAAARVKFAAPIHRLDKENSHFNIPGSK